LWLHATCSSLQLGLGVFATIRSNFNYFDHFYNYVSIIENFIILVECFFSLFSSTNRLICLTSCINNQVNRILKLLYDDLGAYLIVCIKVIFMIYCLYHKYIVVHILIMHTYVYCSYIEFEFFYFNSEFLKFKPKSWYLKLKKLIWIILNQKNIIWFENWKLSFQLLFLNLNFNISRQKIINRVLKWTFQFWVFLFDSKNW
jgi:hypothetical protein